MTKDEKTLLSGLLTRNIRSIAKALTLIESTQRKHQRASDALLADIMPHTGNALRIGISGIPGVGKSTFIEAFGLQLIAKGLRVAVLAIDPSSPISGGSILGDKTRMEKLAVHPNSFIRPSPSRGSLGGVARRTREACLIMDAAGFDIIIIETVGVGQSEILVSSMVDVFLMLQMPSTGDELQTIKKGILELADIVAVNKADGDLAASAERAAAMLKSAFKLVATHEGWSPPVIQCSAKTSKNIDVVWKEIEAFVDRQRVTGQWQKRRQSQIQKWFDEEVTQHLLGYLTDDQRCKALMESARREAISGQKPVSTAARAVVRELFDRCRDNESRDGDASQGKPSLP